MEIGCDWEAVASAIDPDALEGLWAFAVMRAYDVDRLAVRKVSSSDERWMEHTANPVPVSADNPTASQRLDDVGIDDDLLTIGYRSAGSGDRQLAGPSLALEGERIRVEWESEVRDPNAARIAAGVFEHVLNLALTDSERPLETVPVADENDLVRIAGWNATEVEHDAERALFALFDDQLSRTPDAAAVEVGDETTTYAELDALVQQVARELVARHVGPGDAVALCAERSLVMTVGMLAILRSGAAYVPIDPAYPDERQNYMISDSTARVILADRVNASRLRSSTSVDVLDLDDAGSGFVAGGVELEDSAATGADPGYVIYTSGSTGRPKGVSMPQRALSNLVEWQLRRPQAVPTPRTLQFSALSFDVSFQEIYSTWASGGTLVLISESARRDANSLLDSLISGQIQRLFLPFVALRALAQTAVRTGNYPTALREVYTAGEQLQVDETVRTFFSSLPDCVLENQYGPSETHVCSAHRLDSDPETWPTLPPIGAPIANSGVYVLDRWGAPRPIGLPGELYVTGTCLADGYLGKDEMTAERFIDLDSGAGVERAYRTGDVVRWLDSGSLEFLGRADGQVKLRGFRVEPGEVTAVLSAAPGVKQSVAVVRDDVGGRSARMVGYLVPDDPAAFDLIAVQQHAAAQMPEYMVPTHWAVIDDLPLTPSGKLDQRSLPMPSFDRDTLGSTYAAPQGDRQKTLVAIWSELLGVDEVGIDDDFFELGGDSLLAVEMMTMIHDRLGLDLPLGALARTRTIAELDAVADGDLSAVWGPLVPLRESGDRTPLFIVHGGSGNVATFPILVEQLPDDQPVYALQWDGLDGSRGTRTIPGMADRYLDEVRAAQPSGPYRLAGQCIGGLIAREMATRLEDDGEVVDFVMMYDSPNLASPAYSSRRVPFPIFQLKRTLASGDELLQRVGVHLRAWLRRPIPPADREVYGSIALTAAAWKYRPSIERPRSRTVFIGSGLSNASNIALAGYWDDGAMGWKYVEAPEFEINVVETGHNEVPYHPDAVAMLAHELGA